MCAKETTLGMNENVLIENIAPACMPAFNQGCSQKVRSGVKGTLRLLPTYVVWSPKSKSPFFPSMLLSRAVIRGGGACP